MTGTVLVEALMRRLLLGLALLSSPALAQDHPKFHITPARQAAWARMKTDYEANPRSPATLGGRIYKLAKDNSECDCRYSDHGQWGTWMYQVTGNASYAVQAWGEIEADFLSRTKTCNNSGISGNYSRGYFVQHAWMYDWLYPALTSDQRTVYMNKINAMAACVNAPPPAAQYQLGTDSDQTTGEYMGLAMWYLATRSYNPTVVDIWEDPGRLLGGLDATGSNYGTYRNSIYRYVTEFSEGGEWLEGYEYGRGTIKLLLVGADAIKTWLGEDKFPEVTAWTPGAADQYIHTLTPGSATVSGSALQPYLWGDTQSPRTYRAFYYFETAMVLAGVAKGTSAGDEIQDWVMDREVASGLKVLDPYPRALPVFDPYATRGDWTTLPTEKYVSGVQQLNARTGWDANAEWFTAHFPRATQADHMPSYWGEFQLWRDGTWAITHPQCYGGTCIDPRGANGLTFSGAPVGNTYRVREFTGAMAQRTGSTPVNYCYIVGTQGGSLWPNHRYGGVQNYIMEHTRSLVWLRDWNVIVVYDRANSKAQSFPSASVSRAFKDWSNGRPAQRKELWISTPVSPTVESGYIEWIYDGATAARTRVTHLLPATRTVTAEADKPCGFTCGYFHAAESDFHARVVPTETNQWEPFLNIWDAYGTGSPAKATLVRDETDHAQGALVTKSGTNVLLMFNAVQGPDLQGPTPGSKNYWDWAPGNQEILEKVRFRHFGYEVQFSAGSNPTKILLFDLDIAASWEYQINGGAAVPLTVQTDGTANISIVTTGIVTLTLTSEVAR